MADFDYTYKGWDKIRPATLAKTGLGDQLKHLERMAKGLSNSGSSLVSNYLAARKQLAAVETARLAAIKACGSNVLYQSARKALEKAAPNREVAQLADVFNKALAKSIEKIAGQMKIASDKQIETIKYLEATIKLTKAGKEVPSPMYVRAVSIIRGGVIQVFAGMDTSALELVDEVKRKASSLSDVNGSLVSACSQHMTKIEQIRKRSGEIGKLAQEAKTLLKIK